MPPSDYWITARYGGKCFECNREFDKGDRVLFEPNTKHTFCDECGAEIRPDTTGPA